jgi:hypothetical protein
MAFPPHKLVLAMILPVMVIAVQYQPVIGIPAVGVNNRFFKDVTLNNRYKLLF